MLVMERLGWTLVLILLFGGVYWLMRTCQRRRIKAGIPPSQRGSVTLTVVVSSGCAICPAQKNVVVQLSQRYPSLRVVTIDAEMQSQQAREHSVMTVPTTLLHAADGTLMYINNGYIALEALVRQVECLAAK